MNPTTSDRIRQVLNLVAALAMIGISIYVVQSGTDQFSEMRPNGDPPLIPAGYAFSIWGPIYAGAVLYALYQLRPSQTTRLLFRDIGWWTILALAATASWLIVAQRREWVWWTVAILATIDVALAMAMLRVSREDITSRADNFFVRVPLSVYFGWCSIAVFANIASALRDTSMTQPGAETTVTFLLLAVATAAAAVMTRKLRANAWYVGPIVWAFIAIAVANINGETRTPNSAIAGAALVAGAVLIIVVLIGRRASRPFNSPHLSN